jgi:pimeloyl-ACP methyl ester carboxylesterase
LFRRGVAHAQSEDHARAVFADLVCESGRVTFFELATPWFDRAKSAKLDPRSITGPVLVLGAERDRIVSPRRARQTAANYPKGTYAEVPGSDHFVLSGDALPVAMDYIDNWTERNHVFV